ncbi:MAG: PQQ-binding-like beta-propeller repeat protein [Sedimentisphaerales bacterium]|nr:PQQ-binding-like beta-propeller repeat protein [Sedimentisphaerales bacterium]
MDTRTKHKWLILLPLIITAIMLFAALASLPYQYYIALRIIVSIVSVYAIILTYYRRKWLMMPLFIAAIFLFNPLSPLSLSRNVWAIIDIICGMLFILSVFVLKEPVQLKIKDRKMVKRKFFLRRIFYIPALAVIIILIFGSWQAWIAINGNEQLSGVQNAIPKPTGIIPPLETGESDWPCWRGPKGDGKSSVTGIIKDWSNGLKKLWEVNFLCQGESNVSWSSVAVCGNRLVVPGRDDYNDLVFCLNSQNGELIWVGSYKAKTGSSHGPGSRATPYIDEERVYTFGRGGVLACWSLNDGQLLWQKNVEDEGGKEPTWGHSSSPLVYQDKVIVQAGGNALVIAYDKITGEVIWKSMQGKAGYAAISSMEIEGITKLLVFHGTGLSCLEPENGAELWSIQWKTDYNVNAATPAVFGSTVFITSGYNTGCQALKVSQTGTEKLWNSKVITSQHSDPIIIDGFVYGYSGQSDQNKGSFKCVELETGKEMWNTDEIGWGTALYVDEHIVCMDIESNLFLVKPDPKQFIKVTELGNVLGKVEHPAWTIPVIANGKLYIRYMQNLICFDIMSL